MSEPRWQQLESLFAQLMEAAPGERRALLRHSTESDPGLEAEALDLLELY